MGGAGGHPAPQDLDGWMRQQERRTLAQERRGSIRHASDLMGPGLGPQAVEILDWSGDETMFNGFFYSRPGALHSPDADEWWIGQTIAQPEGFGVQTVWDYRGLSVPIATFSRRFGAAGGTRVFSTWA